MMPETFKANRQASAFPSKHALDRFQSAPYCGCKFVGNNAQVRRLRRYPLALRAWPKNTFAGSWNANLTPSIPDRLAGVAAVQQNVSNRRHTPRLAESFPTPASFSHIVEPPHARFGFRVVTGTVAQLSRLRFSRFSAGETNHLRSQRPGSTLVKKQAVWREPSSLDELPPNASRRRRRSRPSRRDAWTARWRGVGAAYADWPDGPHRWW